MWFKTGRKEAGPHANYRGSHTDIATGPYRSAGVFEFTKILNRGGMTF